MGLKRKTVVVHLKTGETVEGLLRRRKPEFVLEFASQLVGEGVDQQPQAVKLDGHLCIPRDNIIFYQRVSK